MSDAMRQELNGVKSELAEVKEALKGFANNMQAVVTGLGELKSAVGGLQTDVGSLKTDVGSLKTDVGSLKTVLHRVAVTTANTSVDLAEFRGYVLGNLVTRHEFHSRMEGFSGQIEDMRYYSAKQKERLDDLRPGSGAP